MTIDDEIVEFATAAGNSGHMQSLLPLLDHLSEAHPDTPPDKLVAQVDAAFDRLYRAGRATFAGHRWLSENLSTVAGFLLGRVAELHYDTTTCTWRWTDTAWTDNVTVRSSAWSNVFR